MEYIKNNKEVFIIIGAMILFAVIAGGYFLITDRNIDNPDIINVPGDNNNDNGKDDWDNDEGFINDSEVIKEYLSCTEYQKSDEVVYIKEKCTVTDSNNNSFTLKLPQINLDSSFINNLNKQLRDDFESDKRLVEFDEKEIFLKVGIYDYVYYESGDIVSILVKREEKMFDSHSWPPSYITYNFNKTTGNELSNAEVVAAWGLNANDSLPVIQGIVRRIYLEEMEYDVDQVNGDPIVESYYNSLDRNFFKRVLINNNNSLVALIELPIPYWSGGETYLIEIKDNSYASYKKDMPL